MKKILSLGLAVTMAMAAMPAAYAADYTAGTQVEYIADADANREYTITVPALLNPGQSGAVTLKGKWASNETVKVTADATVELTNSINSNDKKVLNIGFNGIEKAGDNTVERTYTENVSVAAMPSDALFGTWSGKFNYNVEFDDGIERISFTVDGTPYTVTKTKDNMAWVDIQEYFNNKGVESPFVIRVVNQRMQVRAIDNSDIYITKDGEYVKYTDVIIDGFSYGLKEDTAA